MYIINITLQNCYYFLRVATHFENRVFTDAPLVLTKFIIMWLFSKDDHIVCKLAFELPKGRDTCAG